MARGFTLCPTCGEPNMPIRRLQAGWRQCPDCEDTAEMMADDAEEMAEQPAVTVTEPR